MINKAIREIPAQMKNTAAGRLSTVALQMALKIMFAANETTISVDAMNANKLPSKKKNNFDLK